MARFLTFHQSKHRMPAARVLRGTLLTAGLALIGFGLHGLLNDPYITDPLDVLIWAVGALVLHDGLWVPALTALGAPLARRPLLRGWLIVAAAVTAVGLPAVLRSGVQRANRSLLPLPYLRNWLLALAACAALGLLGAAAQWWRRRGRGPVSDPPPRAGRW
ncbi:hypothetical protein P3T35_005795 [Kitasatospora sp. GP30]|nr:hypothetical protein [Kitasatospora sp. GP30]